MFRNYLQSAWRSFFRDRLNTLINLFGLSIGLACSILIYKYVRNELTYDQFHSNSDRIYRVYTAQQTESGSYTNVRAATSALLGPALKASVPGLEEYVRITMMPGVIMHEAMVNNEEIALFDSAFFRIFDAGVIYGSLYRVLDDPGNLVLTKSTANKYFGNENPVGETLKFKLGNVTKELSIKAVIDDPPTNSSFKFDMVAAYHLVKSFFPEEMIYSWYSYFGETFVLLDPASNPDDITDIMRPEIKKHLGDRWEQGKYEICLQPLKDIHFDSDMFDSMVETADQKYIWVLAGIALLILALASINYTTLSIGRSFIRAREVGIRKVIGATRLQLVAQFIGESMLFTMLCMLVALIIARLALPWFNQLASTALQFNFDVTDILILLSLGLMVGILSGSYPAFFVSAFRSDQIFKGNFGSKLRKQHLRKGLVIVQYVISIAFLSVTLIMLQQLRFLLNRDLGFRKEAVINIPMNVDNLFGFKNSLESALEKGKKVKRELEMISGVQSVGFSTNTFDGKIWIRVGSEEEGKADEMMMLSASFVDPGFIPTLGIQLTEGRNFSELMPSDYQNAIIVNESLVAAAGWEQALTGNLPGQYAAHKVVGVVQDFSYEQPHQAVRPLYLCMNPDFMLDAMTSLRMENMIQTNMYVKIGSAGRDETLAAIEKKIRTLYPEEPFEYTFLDDAIAVQYQREQNTRRILSTATFLAILISCLGLFGLSLLMLNARTKELGIRKVMGASFQTLLKTLITDYVIMILLATVVAVPLAYYASSKWIQAFEYRIVLAPKYFVLASLITLLLAILTVSYLAVRSANTKPAEALRYE